MVCVKVGDILKKRCGKFGNGIQQPNCMMPGSGSIQTSEEASMPTIKDIIMFLGSEGSTQLLESEAGNLVIRRPAPIVESEPGDVAFCSATARDPESLLNQAKCSLLIVDRSIKVDLERLSANGVKAIIYSDNARLDFIRLMEHFFARPRPQGIHPSAIISPKAKIGKNVYIGPLCSIGEAEIGDNCVIYAGVHIYDGVRIGRNVTIHSGTVIGADGFGYERDETGKLVKFPHVGGVIIEDDVEIGANTCIDRGTLGDTRICTGARIDNLVHIAHNVYIGKHAVVIANTMVGGGTRIEDYAWIAPSACLRDRITIGTRAVVGLGALVTKDVPEGITVLGAPARELSEYKRLLAQWSSIVQSIKENE
jgi:UDP-3-O-[3-hydroxymyristoyl] glucosamine N-acyltransferase